MNEGNILLADTPKQIKTKMHGSVIEIVPNDLRFAAETLRPHTEIIEVQAFGDRINVVAENGTDPKAIIGWLEAAGIKAESSRTVQPSLENVFISLLKEQTEHA